MRYRAYKKVSHQRWRRQDPHQKQYVPHPLNWQDQNSASNLLEKLTLYSLLLHGRNDL